MYKQTLNNVPYSLPSIQGTSNTALFNDGNGNLSWQSLNTYSTTQIDSLLLTKENSFTTLPINKGGTGSNIRNYVDLTSNESISGIKTFIDSPIIPLAINNNQAARLEQITATKVGNTLPQWNANTLQNVSVADTIPTTNQLLIYNSETNKWEATTFTATIHGQREGANTHQVATTTVNGFMSSGDKTKLNGIANNATSNDSNTSLRNRATHTGVQPISSITNLQTSLDSKESSFSILSINKGGTGSNSRNFVDLTSNESIGGIKSFSSGLINLTNSSTNTINFGEGASGFPTLNTRSSGTKIILRENLTATNNLTDYAIGIGSTGTIWQSIPINNADVAFQWYGGVVQVARLDGIGNLNLEGNLNLKNSIAFNNTSSSLINFRTIGIQPPIFGSTSNGTKIILYESISSITTNYAIGIDNSSFWQSIPESSSIYKFKWYGGTTEIASLTGTGVLNTSKGYFINGMPVHYQLTRTLPSTLNDFIEIGTFVSGYSVMRITITLANSGVSETASYDISTTFVGAPTPWYRVSPTNYQSYNNVFSFSLDLKIDGITSYLRLRRFNSTDIPSVAKITIECLGNNENASFTETSITGNDPNVFIQYRNGLQTFNGINYLANLQITDGVPWLTPNLFSGWSNFGGGHALAGYRKLADGTIELKGLITKDSAATNEVLFYLNPGYRPTEVRLFNIIHASGTGRIDVSPDGAVTLFAGASNGWVSLESIRFGIT